MARTVLWAYGFDGKPEEVEAAVDAIGPTKFDTVILPFIHVREPLQLYYNDTPLAKVWSGLPKAIERLKSGFPVKKRVLMSVGPFQSDFDAIAKDYMGFVREFIKFTTANRIDGMDLDYEGSFEPGDAKLLALMVENYRSTLANALVTAAPYNNEEFWTGPKGVLSMTRTGQGTSMFSWFNVQFYEGTYNRRPEEYPGHFDLWAEKIGRQGNGVSDAQSFIVPGCNGAKEAERKFSPKDMEAGLRAIRQTHSSIGGGFVWNYDGLEWSPPEWADAIVNGCS
ncbi:MAG: hypothetical protein ACTHO8_01625 [Solirubrobacterales bacterium]